MVDRRLFLRILLALVVSTTFTALGILWGKRSRKTENVSP